MKYFYLLRYRLEHNDIHLRNKITAIIISIFIFIIIPLFYITNPFENLRTILSSKGHVVLAYKNIESTTNLIHPNTTLPIAGTVTSSYGYRTDPINGKYSKHTGIDISGIHHDNIRTIDDGIITFAGSQNGYGYCIEIKHSSSSKIYYSFYAHLSSIKVSLNQLVHKGDIIAIEGGDPKSDPNPGYSTGHHLHFEIRKYSGYGNDIDPTSYINQKY